jgi:hypothetical protein
VTTTPPVTRVAPATTARPWTSATFVFPGPGYPWYCCGGYGGGGYGGGRH